MDGYRHFLRVENGIVVEGYADWQLEKRHTGEIQLSGEYGRQFEFPLYTDRMQYKYKIVNGTMVERTQEELDEEWAARPPAPKTPEQKEIEKLKADKEELNLKIIDLWETLIDAGVL